MYKDLETDDSTGPGNGSYFLYHTGNIWGKSSI